MKRHEYFTLCITRSKQLMEYERISLGQSCWSVFSIVWCVHSLIYIKRCSIACTHRFRVFSRTFPEHYFLFVLIEELGSFENNADQFYFLHTAWDCIVESQESRGLQLQNNRNQLLSEPQAQTNCPKIIGPYRDAEGHLMSAI